MLICKAFMPSMGRGQISVKPTGHARFSVENYQTYLEFINYFQRKSIGSKAVYFIYLISCCETFCH